MDKCPKCGKKLTVFNVKQNCPECGCDILNYDLEKRLEEDALQAEKEFEELEIFLAKVKRIAYKILSFFGVKKK